MELILIFGVWMNLQSVDNLRDYNDFWHGSRQKTTCIVFFRGDTRVTISDIACIEVAAEINKHLQPITKGEDK